MRETFVPLDPEAQLGYLLVRSADQVSREWFAAFRAHGINPRQFSMLACLARDPGISQGNLAQQVMITPQSVSESVSGLLKAGLITRGAVEPGRSARLTLTHEGRRLLAAANPVVKAANRESFTSLTRTERRQLARLLARLLR